MQIAASPLTSPFSPVGAPAAPRAVALLLLFGVGCTDYTLGAEKPLEEGAEDTSPPEEEPDPVDSGDPPEDTDEPVDRSCTDASTPGADIGLNEACYVPYTPGTFTPVVEYKKSSWAVDSSSNNIMMMPAVASLTDDNGDGLINADDIPDIIVVTYGGYGTLRAVSGDSGAELWNVTGHNLQGQGAVAVGDIDNDGFVEIVACTSGTVKAFEHDGTFKWESTTLYGHMYGTSDAPAISDMDGDGQPEIIVGRAILTNTGALRGAGSAGMGGTLNVGTTSFAVDLDADGVQEVITGNAVYRPDGTSIWNNGEADGYVAVADFDGDGQGEIVVMREGVVRLQDTNGTVLWRSAITGGSSYYGGPPTVADFDGDGQPEVGVAGRSNYTVFDTNGTRLWERTTQDASSGNTGSAVFDFEGDGFAEVVYADETRLWVFSGVDGSVKLESTEHSNATWTEYSVIADVDGDGHAEIVSPNTSGHYGFYVFGDADDSWQQGPRIWNQHAYHITNVEPDGGIPAVADLNWLRYNNFRSGDLTAGQDGEYPDLLVQIPDICLDDCDEGRIQVEVQVGNRGYLELPGPVRVELWGEITDGSPVMLDRRDVAGPFPAGTLLSSYTVDVDVTSFGLSRLWAEVDGGNAASDGAFEECDEANNESVWPENLCP